jgi:hypothetical protein
MKSRVFSNFVKITKELPPILFLCLAGRTKFRTLDHYVSSESGENASGILKNQWYME